MSFGRLRPEPIMSLSAYLAFLLACVVVVIVPGPTVTLIVANSLRHGRRAGIAECGGHSARTRANRRSALGPCFVDRVDGSVVHLVSPCRRGLFDLARLQAAYGVG
jgi:hypothetical protein